MYWPQARNISLVGSHRGWPKDAIIDI